MKVIGAKSLVQINPSVVEVGSRASPGVFDFDHSQPPLISCTGALNITDPIYISGDWKLEVDGELIFPDATNINDILDYLFENGFDVILASNDPTPIAALNVVNDTEYRVSMNGTPLLNPATNISSFKNLGKYPNFVVDGTTSFDLYMAVVTATGGKATAIGYQNAPVEPSDPMYTEDPILALITEDKTGFTFEFEALTGGTDITQNIGYEQILIDKSFTPDSPLNGTIQKADNIVSCMVKAPASFISCAGATNRIVLDIANFIGLNSPINVEVNGTSHLFASRSDFIDYFNTVFDLPTLAKDDFYLFSSYAGQQMRVAITTSEDNFTPPSQLEDFDGQLNPTFGFNDKTLTFCLNQGI